MRRKGRSLKPTSGSSRNQAAAEMQSPVIDANQIAGLRRASMIRRGIQITDVYHPEQDPFTSRGWLEIPKDKVEINKLCRYYYTVEPFISTPVELAVEFPFSNFQVQHTDKKLDAFFNEMVEDLDLFSFILDMELETQIVGESFPFGFLDDPDDPTMWTGFILLNPDFVKVVRTLLINPEHGQRQTIFINFSKDKDLQKIVQAGPGDRQLGPLYERLPEDVIHAVRTGSLYELNPLQASQHKRPGDYHNPDGTSAIKRCLQVLRYRDQLREAQYAIADRHAVPVEFYYVGSDEHPAEQDEIDLVEQALAAAWVGTNRSIVLPHDVRAEIVGAAGRLLNMAEEFDYIERNILVAMGMSRAFLSGEGPTFANASVALDVMIARYITRRQRVEKWLQQHVFSPICRIHEIYKPKEAEIQHGIRVRRREKPWVPDVAWQKSNLRDEQERIRLWSELQTRGLIPRARLWKLLNLDPAEIEEELREEAKNPLPMPPTGEAPLTPGMGLPSIPMGGGGGEEEIGELPSLIEETQAESPLEGGNRQMPPESSRNVQLPAG